jgi:hypothetical protein
MKTYIPILCALILAITGCSKSDNNDNGNNPGSYSTTRSVGASAKDLLSNSTYTSAKIEIQYMPGFAPDAGAIAHLSGFLGSYLNKPGGILIVQKEITASGNTTLSIQDIASIEKQNRTVFTTGSEMGIYILYTNGIFSENKVLGSSYHNTSMVVYGKTIHDNSGGLGQTSRTKLEATILTHEFGHLLGLVDIGTAMQTNHKDAAHAGHCNNSNCLMYHTAETTDALGLLVSGSIPSLDANCTVDLTANGGK